MKKVPALLPGLALALLLLSSCVMPGPVVSSPGASAPAASSPRPKAYTSADTLPAMPNRAPELVPGAIPPHVRYRVADDATVTRLAATLKTALASGDPAFYSDLVLVQPGAWIYLRNDLTLDLKDAAQLTMLDPGAMRQQLEQGGGRPGRMFRTRHAMELLAPELAKLLRDDGGFHLRALKTDEMARWWPYIGFDIEEPIYVAESAHGRYRFVIHLLKDRIFLIDELNGLPSGN